MDLSQYRDLFVQEASKNLLEMDESLSRLSQDPGNEDEIAVLFRHAHSIKGMAASLGCNIIADLSHKTEDLMDRVRSGKQKCTAEILNLIYEAADSLQDLVDRVASGEKNLPECSALIKKLAHCGIVQPDFARTSRPSPSLPKLLKEQEANRSEGKLARDLPANWKLYKIHVCLSQATAAPSARIFLLIVELEKIGVVKKTYPPREKIEGGQIQAHNFWLFLISMQNTEAVEEIVRSGVEVESFSIHEIMRQGPGAGKRGRNAFSRTPEEAEKSGFLPAYKKPASVRVDTPALDNLINIMGEVMIQERHLIDLTDKEGSPEVQESLAELQRFIKRLHHQIMKLRMMPLSALLDMLPRAVRELQRDTGKKVELKILGKDIRLDRSILEGLGDPLLHMIRNAMDHGFEGPEERKKCGKDPVGKLEIICWKEKDLAFIQIEDNGRGIDAGEVKQRAVARGILSPEEARGLLKEEALALICSPGLSTAKNISGISGRGVGMDVVKAFIENLGGNLFIDSIPGRGTKFILRMPMTVATTKVLLMRVGGLLLGIPFIKILFIEEIRPVETRSEQGRLFFIRRDERVPFYDLASLLKIKEDVSIKGTSQVMVCVEIMEKKIGLAIDQTLTGLEAVIKPLGLPLTTLRYYSGAVVTGTGEMALVLDVERLRGRIRKHDLGFNLVQKFHGSA